MLLFRRLLRRYLKEGTLTVIDPGGHRELYGRGEPHVTICIHDASWPQRVLWEPALAIGEGYMDGAYTIE
jgi:cyclopropane-fatty-acyl-phospholipid synthase